MIRQMDQSTAIDELRDMVAWESHPQLSEPQVIRLLIGASTKDVNGKIPSDKEWVPTYDLDAAAAEGWRRKGAVVAGDYDFEDNGSKLTRSQVIANCLKMANEYAKKISPGVRLFAYADENALRDAFEQDIRDGFRVFEGAWFSP